MQQQTISTLAATLLIDQTLLNLPGVYLAMRYDSGGFNKSIDMIQRTGSDRCAFKATGPGTTID